MKEKESESIALATDVQSELALILYNDDVNTFDHVIHCLVTVCEMELMAAEQCAYIVHYGGKCAVKHGAYEDLEPRCLTLLEKGLSAKIEN
jgi:ATP-dependent Clp protease adaptor protein ClpS